MNLEKLRNYNIFKEDLLSLDILKNQGFNNINYLLKTSKDKYIIRVFKSNSSVNISRKFEFDTQKKAYTHNIAAKPIILNNDFMVYKYSKGIHKTKLSKIDIKNLVLKLKKFHSFKTINKTYDFNADFKEYKKTLKDNKSQKLIIDSIKILNKLKKYKLQLGLVHHDLNPKNIIFLNNNIKIIDWEYAGTNDIFFDLATICIEFRLNSKEERILLNSYFPLFKSFFTIKLKYYKLIYTNLCELWFLKNK